MSLEPETKPQEMKPAESRMPIPASGERLTLMDVWRVLMKRRVVILVVTIISVAGALWYAMRTPPTYETTAQVEIESQTTPNIGIDQIYSQAGTSERIVALATEIHILESDSMLFQTAQSLNLIDSIRAAEAAARKKNHQAEPAPGAEITPEERRSMISLIRGGLSASILQGTNIVEIRFRSQDPKLAAAIVNRLVETYSDRGMRSKYDRTMHVSTWLQTQLQDLKAQATDAQRQLADYQREHNIVGTDANSNLTIQTLEQISLSVDQAEANRIVKEARMRDFDSLSPNLVAVMGDNPALSALRSRLADLQTQQAQLSVRLGPKNPRIIDLQAQIDKIQAQIDSEVTLARRQVHDEYEAALGAEQSLRKRLGTQEEEVYKLNEGAAQFAILSQQAALTRNLYDTLQLRLEEATVTAGLSAANITVVDSAQVPYLPVLPRKRLSVILGLFGGLICGCALAFLIDSIDDRLQTSDEVEAVSMLPSLAAIPHIYGESKKPNDRDKKPDLRTTLDKQLIALRDSKSVGAEAYRNLRSSLLLASIDHPPRIIVIASAFPREGKTTTAINTAIVLAQRGERVLLVDADLRRGSLAKVFGLQGQNIGLSTLLANPGAKREIPVPLPELPTLHVLPRGPRPPNPAEMLSSNRMEEQLRQWLQEYDRIVLDTAPLLAISDTQSVATLADTVVLIARAGMTRRRALIRARDMLLRINVPIAGVVVNDVDMRLENFYTYRYGMYGYGYGYGYRYGNSGRAYGYEKEDVDVE